MTRFVLALSCVVILLIGINFPVYATAVQQDVSVQFEHQPVDYTFGGQVTLSVKIQADQPLQQVNVYYRPSNQPDTRYGQATLDEDGLATYTIDLTHSYVPAFAEITYWFDVVLEDGSQVSSPPYTFRYDDNRFEWTMLEEFPTKVSWYSGDQSLGQYILDVANQGLDKINRLIAAYPQELITAYIYDNSLDMQSTLLLGNIKWIAGHADPDMGVVVISLPPGPEQRAMARQRVPHELMHVMLYRKMGSGYSNLPAWFSEGLASLAELENNPDYITILEKADEKGLYIPLTALCKSFPQDASGAFLAYAESEWFTRFMFEQYGASKMQELIDAYADGLACERAPEVVFGKSLNELDQDWRRNQFGEEPVLIGWLDILPWLLLLGIALATPVMMMLLLPTRSRRRVRRI